MKKNLSKEQLFDHFTGKSSLLVKQEIEAWLQNPAHEELYYQWLEEWERLNAHWAIDSDAEFARLQFKINGQSADNEPVENNRFTPFWRRKWLSLAASVLFVVLGGYLFRDSILYKTYSTAFGVMQNVALADGTKVNLNANSTLRVPRFGFGTDTRQVLLEGEAYFSVTHTPNNQKFVVKTNRDFSIEVLGTEFAVRERERGCLRRQRLLHHHRVHRHHVGLAFAGLHGVIIGHLHHVFVHRHCGIGRGFVHGVDGFHHAVHVHGRKLGAGHFGRVHRLSHPQRRGGKSGEKRQSGSGADKVCHRRVSLNWIECAVGTPYP